MCDGSCACKGRSFVRFSGSEDWSALYVDGRLDKVGDHYLVDERIADFLNVETTTKM